MSEQASQGESDTVKFKLYPSAHLRCPYFDDPELERIWRGLWNERLRIFRRLFPWIGEEIKRLAGLPADALIGTASSHENNVAHLAASDDYRRGYRSDDERVHRLHDRQNSEWLKLTGLPPLGTIEDWRAAAAAAGIPAADFEQHGFERIADCILAWALAKAANRTSPGGAVETSQPPAVQTPDAVASGASEDGDGRETSDVFLSYNSDDRRGVEELAGMLEKGGLFVWMDRARLAGGKDWQDDIGKGIDRSSSFVVCLGPTGLGPWQKVEIERALKRKQADAKFPVIPVLLPGSPDEPDLPFALDRLDRFHRRSFRDGFNGSELQRLIRDINPAAAYPTPDNYERDKWIYEQRRAGRTIPEIQGDLNQTKWYLLDSPNGIRDAVKRYANYAELPVPKSRPGKRRKQ
ncbi:MAG TPA: toll/interleukin-1 receptor domain-containing protein [Thermoguttaceae bacterium]|nr:toll/interleukin-1 receptor domain-containing protein [Thermoguttaceae bacterium]